MIRVRRPIEAPQILRERGAELGDQCCREAEAGALDFEFNGEVYGHKSVKRALAEAQHGKCCYCETKVGPGAYGDVEHFRPKKAVKQRRGDPESKPGYYWLAYAWNNLLFSCQVCNQSHKGSLFPLADPGRRACSHRHALADESPLLLDPASDDPERSIAFRREVPFGRDRRGEETIRCLGLDRRELCEERADVLARVEGLLDVLEIVSHEGDRAGCRDRVLDDLVRMSEDSGRYASMVRAYLRDRLGEDLKFPVSCEELSSRVRRRFAARVESVE